MVSLLDLTEAKQACAAARVGAELGLLGASSYGRRPTELSARSDLVVRQAPAQRRKRGEDKHDLQVGQTPQPLVVDCSIMPAGPRERPGAPWSS